MVNEGQQEILKESEQDVQGQLGSVLSGVERSLAVTCDTIMGKMKQLEDKILDMEKRYNELARDAETAIKEASDDKEAKNASEE